MSESKLWNQINQYVDLYKFYWDLSLKLFMFFVGASGAVSAYVIKNQEVSYMGISLVIPISFCIFGAWLIHRSMPGFKLMREEVQRLADELELESHPEFRSLITFVSAVRALLICCAVGMLALWLLLSCSK